MSLANTRRAGPSSSFFLSLIKEKAINLTFQCCLVMFEMHEKRLRKFTQRNIFKFCFLSLWVTWVNDSVRGQKIIESEAAFFFRRPHFYTSP